MLPYPIQEYPDAYKMVLGAWDDDDATLGRGAFLNTQDDAACLAKMC
jgi:hypothetical protein